MRTKTRRPPRRCCAECGGDYYGWREYGLCDPCGKLLRENLGRSESLRALAKRLREGDRAAGLG